MAHGILRAASARRPSRSMAHCRSNDGSVVLQWALEGRGIVVRSQWEIEEHLARAELVPLLAEWTLPDANIHAIYLERNQLSMKLRTFVDFLGTYLRTPGKVA